MPLDSLPFSSSGACTAIKAGDTSVYTSTLYLPNNSVKDRYIVGMQEIENQVIRENDKEALL